MMSFCKGVANSRMMSRVPRHVGSTLLSAEGLTTPFQNVTINPNRGDQEFMKEIQPHLNVGLWPIYLAQCELEFHLPPIDGTQEAPGATAPNPPVPAADE